MNLTSPAFEDGAPIPSKYTCEGADVSPPLEWVGAPAETQSFALICDDPDAPIGTWVHWVIHDLPAHATSLPEGVTPLKHRPDTSRQGTNDFKRIGYGGPCPPPGMPHRYLFKLYALDQQLSLPDGATKSQLERAMDGHILEKTTLVGTYQR